MLDEYGRLVMWGNNGFLQMGRTRRVGRTVTTNFYPASFAGGDYHTAMLLPDGELWIFGYNRYGQMGNGSVQRTFFDFKVMDDVIFVAVGGSTTFAIDSDDVLWGWGRNNFGQLGDGTTENRTSPIRIMENVKYVAPGRYHTLVITTEGNLYSFGRNHRGQLGVGRVDRPDFLDKLTPVRVNIPESVAIAAAGNRHSLVVTESGELWAFGCNDFGQLGRDDLPRSSAPVFVMSNVRVPYSNIQEVN
jgi:alpha-tubulin suppressor-like RCC1 family protein